MLNRKTRKKQTAIKTLYNTKFGLHRKSWELSDRSQEIAKVWILVWEKTGSFLHIPVSMMMVEQRIMSQGK
jgi:hypothetical protein